MAQWLRVRLRMQGTRVRSLVRDDPTCRRVAGPAPWSPRATTAEVRGPRARAPQHPPHPRSLQLERARTQQGRPNAAKNK